MNDMYDRYRYAWPIFMADIHDRYDIYDRYRYYLDYNMLEFDVMTFNVVECEVTGVWGEGASGGSSWSEAAGTWFPQRHRRS